MLQSPLQRPIGFAPSEISSLVNERVISQHAEEAAFLWTLRHRAVAEPHYALDDLAKLDERVEAHLEGLRLAGDVGWKFCKANLENLGPGEIFAAAVLAFGAGDRDRMTETLLAGGGSRNVTSGLISALGWLDFRDVWEWIDRLLQARSPAHRAVGLRAAAVHRRDTGSFLADAVVDPDPIVRASALRSVGELRRDDLVPQVRASLRGDDDGCRFWAAWALALNGEPDGVSELNTWITAPSELGDRAIQVALRAMKLEAARNCIRQWAAQPGSVRAAIVGAGVVGDSASIPWLIAKMQIPEMARLAGEAFTMITGADLSYSDLDEDGPVEEPHDEVARAGVDLIAESNLAWPSPTRVAEWWDAHKGDFVSGVRCLAGVPIEEKSLHRTLRFGKQRQRIAAALELALTTSSGVLFETRARGSAQLARLG